jgi:hypothetical protein
MTGGTGADRFKSGEGHDHITYGSKPDGDVVDISSVYDSSTDHYELNNDGGQVMLSIVNDSGVEKGSITFDDIAYDESMTLDELLGDSGIVEVDDGT